MHQIHRAGFVSIIGRPNVGKSTLMNELVGEKLSIITAKAQTTRHRIRGVLSGSDFQVVYSDTPGLLVPNYLLHKAMMTYVRKSLEDADIVLLVVAPDEEYDPALFQLLTWSKAPLILALNKMDIMKKKELNRKIKYWKDCVPSDTTIPISALKKVNTDTLLENILSRLPEHPPYFPKEDLADRSERFFAAEIIREKIFLYYSQEVPYSTAVSVEELKHREGGICVSALIFVEKATQKAILIGKKGESLRRVAVSAGKDMESFLGRKIFLNLRVKVAKNWKQNNRTLRQFGYME